MEQFLFRKVEVWILGLILVVGILVMIAFGMLVRNHAQGNDRFGMAGEAAYRIASIPATTKKLLSNSNVMVAAEGKSRFAEDGKKGWRESSRLDGPVEQGYLLLSRYDGDLMRPVVELVRLSNKEVLHRWVPDIEKIFSGLEREITYGNPKIDNEKFRIIHPVVFENGDLLVKDHGTPMARINACGQKVWANGQTFHHSTEIDADGNIWVPGYFSPSAIEWTKKEFHDDSLVKISPDGVILSERSVAEILVSNGYDFFLAGMSEAKGNDPLHLNDIQPVLTDGQFWKKGDLFLSFRHKSTILLYRPSTDKVIWLRSGPWFYQHDIDINEDGKISVFSNNVNHDLLQQDGEQFNRVLQYDFRTDQVTSILQSSFEIAEIRTATEGLHSFLPSGTLMVEEENFGRLVLISPDGRISAEYVNGAEDELTYGMGWTRFVSKDLGDRVVGALGTQTCNAAAD